MRWLIALAVIAALCLGERFAALRITEKRMIHTHRQGPRTPAARGLVFEEVPVDSEGRALKSFYVPADGPALLILHGNNEAISGWVDALALLHEHGIAAMVFDYSGFGDSPGEPTFAHFHADALAAWHAFRVRVPGGVRACAYGLSLGSGVLLETAPELSPKPDCLAVSGAFLSARAIAARRHLLPWWGTWLLPDLLDSLDNAGRTRIPLLVEQGSEDEMFPPDWARQLAAAHEGGQVVIVPGMHHADPVVHPGETSWRPVVDFVKPKAAPSAPIAK
ncbi:MAG TPA: alpha/beta hydrolase [Myxococcales bacterium]|nr:alpha/beta hydrolase [Myxococcales bacterium]